MPFLETESAGHLPEHDMGVTPDTAKRTPRLSIGVPVYNEERYLDGCIRSLLAQTFTDFEIIICDNASTDGTFEIAQEWAQKDARISAHRAERNLGAAPNFNWCFELARGELFKWAAADDLVKPDYLEKCIAALDAHPESHLAYSGAYDIDAEGEIIGEIHDNQWPMRFDSPDVRGRLTPVDRTMVVLAALGTVATLVGMVYGFR